MIKEKVKGFPPAIELKKILGPSFIILALGLGSGEVILWPYLSSNYGLGIAWGALLGITFQYFLNMEIERYALIKGESVFVGFNKMFRWAAYWFIISTFVGFGLPGIIASAAKVFAYIIGLDNFKWVAAIFLILIGVILSAGKTVYGMLEKVTRTIIFIGIPFIFILAMLLTDSNDWLSLGKGLVGVGNNYLFLPLGISLATFLTAFAYSGAGGNLNLTQSIYVKEKGYGMGCYSQKISGLFRNVRGKKQVKLEGENFAVNAESITNFKKWWKKINFEHLLVFWFLGIVGICVLMLLAYSTTYGLEGNANDINFVINEGLMIGKRLFGAMGIIFLLVVSIMLFQTQLGIMDSTSRIMAENVALKIMEKRGQSLINLSKIYFIFVWAQIAFGITLILFNIYQPRLLLVLGGVINAVAMFVYAGMLIWLNQKKLDAAFRPLWWRKAVMIIIFLFFGVFSLITLFDTLKKLF